MKATLSIAGHKPRQLTVKMADKKGFYLDDECLTVYVVGYQEFIDMQVMYINQSSEGLDVPALLRVQA